MGSHWTFGKICWLRPCFFFGGLEDSSFADGAMIWAERWIQVRLPFLSWVPWDFFSFKKKGCCSEQKFCFWRNLCFLCIYFCFFSNLCATFRRFGSFFLGGESSFRVDGRSTVDPFFKTSTTQWIDDLCFQRVNCLNKWSLRKKWLVDVGWRWWTFSAKSGMACRIHPGKLEKNTLRILPPFKTTLLAIPDLKLGWGSIRKRSPNASF